MLRVFGQPKMAAILFLGFSSGLPFFLANRTLQAWMTLEGVDLTTIGLSALLAQVPVGAADGPLRPAVPRAATRMVGHHADRPFAGIGGMALQDPSRTLQLVAFNAVWIAFFSARQDVVFEAYPVDVLDERGTGAGAALGVLGTESR